MIQAAGAAGPIAGGDAGSADASRLGYVQAIDGLRAIAILSVVLFHLRPLRLPGGFAGVDVFFVISGFVVTASLARLRFQRFRDLLVYFYARRILRIVPALAVMLLTTTILVILFVPSFGMLEKSAVGIAAFAGVSNILLALGESGYFGGGADLNPFLHSWTLGVEEQFYLLFPFFFYFLHAGFGRAAPGRGAMAFMAAAVLVSLGLCAWLTGLRWQYAFYLMPSRFWELGAGILLFLTIARWRPFLASVGTAWLSALSLACALALAAFFLADARSWSPFPALLVPVVATAGLIASVCAGPELAVTRILSTRGPVFVGMISYSLYLWHWPIFVLFRWTVGLDSRVEALAALSLSFAAAVASWSLIERPFRDGRARDRRPGLVRAALVILAVGGVASAALLLNHRALSPSVADRRIVWQGLEKPGTCALSTTERRVAIARVQSWTPMCQPDPNGRRLIVVGDSHALAYSPMLERYASAARVPVLLYGSFGCDFPGFWSPMDANPRCRAFYREVEAALQSAGTRDIVFMPGLRVRRMVSASGEPTGDKWRPGPESAKAAEAEARAILSRLSRTGAMLVLEAPKPVLPITPFRCSDWFNRSNSACSAPPYVERSDIERRRAATMATMARLRRDVPGLHVWDPVPILCPADRCSAYDRGVALYHDGDHLSGRAGDLLYPDFSAFLARAARAPAPE